MKKCNTCNETKSLSEFYSQNKTKADGTLYIYYNPKCKECTIKDTRKSQEKYKDYLVDYRKKRYSHKKDYYIEKATKRNMENKDEIREYQRKWLQSNKDKVKQYNEYRKMHKSHDITINEWLACKEYFDNSCAYCGLHESEHYNLFYGELRLQDLHKDHVNHEGSNDITNCLPSCKSCNSSKHTSELEDWYNERNSNFTQERLYKINKWLYEDVYKLK